MTVVFPVPGGPQMYVISLVSAASTARFWFSVLPGYFESSPYRNIFLASYTLPPCKSIRSPAGFGFSAFSSMQPMSRSIKTVAPFSRRALPSAPVSSILEDMIMEFSSKLTTVTLNCSLPMVSLHGVSAGIAGAYSTLNLYQNSAPLLSIRLPANSSVDDSPLLLTLCISSSSACLNSASIPCSSTRSLSIKSGISHTLTWFL